jgi:FkbM family methyltransferase
MKRSISFEPDPTNFALTWSNVRLNGLEDRFDLHPVALGPESGECKFEVSTSNCGDHRVRTKEHESAGEKYEESGREVITVPMRSLDDVLDKCPGDFKRRIGLCWIDVQGFEGGVLRGGEKHFSKHGWPSVLEFWPYGMARAGIDAGALAGLLAKSWTKFAVIEEGNDVWHPISHVSTLWKSVGPDGDFVNLLMMR